MAHKRLINKLVRQIVKGSGSTQVDHASDKVDGGFHLDLVTALRTKGFRTYNSYSKCSVAYGGENHLKKDDIEVEIITSSLFGTFTEIRVRSY